MNVAGLYLFLICASGGIFFSQARVLCCALLLQLVFAFIVVKVVFITKVQNKCHKQVF